jgi:hypothetical protein
MTSRSITRLFPVHLPLLVVVLWPAACKRQNPVAPPVEPAAVAGAAGAGAPAAPVAGTPAECQACELKSRNRNCNPSYLTARRDKSGEPVPGSFGCGTLASPAAQAACSALVTCINRNRCPIDPRTKASPGDNAVQGCYCGAKTDTKECMGGTGVAGPCVAEYHAAASATDGGPKREAKEADFATFIAPRAFDATSAFGLADNIVTCAVDAPCPACGAL